MTVNIPRMHPRELKTENELDLTPRGAKQQLQTKIALVIAEVHFAFPLPGFLFMFHTSERVLDEAVILNPL